MGASLDPQSVSAALGLDPSHAHRQGDLRQGRDGRTYAPYTEGHWSLAVEDKTEPNVCLKALAEILLPRREHWEAYLREGARADIFVGVFGDAGNVGFTLEPEVLSLLAELGLVVDFDVYC